MASIDMFTQQDLLSRLEDTETHLTVFSRSNKSGWTPVVAWDPKEKLIIDGSMQNIEEKISEFVSFQQHQGRLVTGYLSYDFGCLKHNVALKTEDDLRTPLSVIFAFENWVDFENEYPTIHAKSQDFRDKVAVILSREMHEQPIKVYDIALSPTWSRYAYNHAYEKVKAYIKAGDIYQANLTHRLQGVSSKSALDIYRKISHESNADFQSYIDASDFQIISASPERFIRIENNIITTMPIKGTRPRGNTPESDEVLRAELESSPKDMAELDMITDLLRNDLGVVSEVGSVQVDKRRVLTPYPTLWHAHSEIHSTLRGDLAPIDALLSMMPGGSITGCPKKRAMEIIDELEDKRRGIYTGSIFMVTPDGTLDSNIAIRTMIKKQNNIYLSVGGGIVYDSAQDDEYEESLQKAAVFMND